jgi:hypothetical protein
VSGARERGLSGSAVRVRERMCREERGCGSTERGRERGREGTREGGRERGREREGASSRERVRGCECLSSLLGASSSAWTPKIPLPQRTRIAAVSCSEYASMVFFLFPTPLRKLRRACVNSPYWSTQRRRDVPTLLTRLPAKYWKLALGGQLVQATARSPARRQCQGGDRQRAQAAS